MPGIFPDRSVAFGVYDETMGTERIVMICDLQKRRLETAERFDIERALRKLIYQELDVSVSEIHLMERGWVVKTANGKLTRGANRQKDEQEILGEG